MLYPLNALINSQEERLGKWFQPFNGNIRYSLYNGATPQNVEMRIARATPEKVVDRATLRSDPPPVLVTNITMLEYMLVRQEDASILNKSQGKLDYIILDEAHSYIGVQAAELSLLLRRVAAAFGKSPSDIRYVATSATIGDGSSETLGQFLADVAGVPRENVEVVTGERAPLARTGDRESPLSIDEMRALPEGQRAEFLFSNRWLGQFRQQLRDDRPVSWSEWTRLTAKIAGNVEASNEDAIAFLDLCTRTKDAHTKDDLLPTRLHLFHKTLPGISVCPNSQCPGKSITDEAWSYGAVTSEQTEHCEACGSIMFEWVSCRSCGDGALLGSESADASHTKPFRKSSNADDFFQELDIDAPDDDEVDAQSEEDEGTSGLRHYLLASESKGQPICFDAQTGKNLDVPDPNAINLNSVRELSECPHCGEGHASGSGDALRAIVASSPYLVRQIVPALLPNLSRRSAAEPLPMGGRSLITFTDARQGTAQHAATLQLASEREFIRGFVYHAVHKRSPADPDLISKLQSDIKKLKAAGPGLEELVAEKVEELAAAQATQKPVPVSELIRDLSQHRDVQNTLLDLWSARSETTAQPVDLAEFLLLRELARRPKWAASGETLGLFRVILPPKTRTLPTIAKQSGITEVEWEALLQLIVTHYFRQNQMIQVKKPGWFRYAGISGAGRSLVRRSDEIIDKKTQKAWPSAHGQFAARVSWISLIAQGLNLTFDDAGHRAQLDELLDALFQALQRSDCLVSNENGLRLDWTKLYVEPVSQAAICPITRLPLQADFKGATIYKSASGTHPKTKSVAYPEFPFAHHKKPDGTSANSVAIDEWLQTDPNVIELRALQLWDNRTDRAARYEGYFRSAEHSAQLSQPDLQAYEAKFKAGILNVLSCSTTMEMGVDIGDVEAVLNTNAPPSIANYKQRLGRAGRRGQSLSIGVTICKDRPLDNQVASAPIDYIKRTQAAPKVSLESNAIVQRHVNAWLLSKFMKEQKGQLLSLTVGGFFKFETPAAPSPLSEFLLWIDQRKADLGASETLAQLLSRTRLTPGIGPIEACYEKISSIARETFAEWEALGGAQGSAKPADEPLVKAQAAQRKRLEGEYLLSALSGRSFLPAYGFPTGVVQFWTETSSERRQREAVNGPTSFEDRRFLSRGMPSRQRNIGIYEFAPGSEIVIDGLLRKSAGVTLNWKRPVSDQDVREVQSLRSVSFCQSCGELSSRPTAVEQASCEACGADNLKPIRYLAPAGFSIDPKDEVTDQRNGGEYSPRHMSVVGASGADWLSLPDPDLGRLRSAPDGIVFDRNDGPDEQGYAVCLECGRAAPETGADDPLPASMDNHKPLRWTPNAGPNEICPGATRSFGIQRSLSLGDEYRTTVFELQLDHISSDKTAITVALALREAIANKLGIEASEMGVAAGQTLNRDGAAQWTSTVFDKAAGGAGFAAQIADDPATTISDAANILDCKRRGACGDENARRVCPNCVLRPDVQHLHDKTDRKKARHALVDAALRLDLPAEFKVFGEASIYLPAPIPTSVRSYLHAGHVEGLLIRAGGTITDWELDQWPMSATLLRLPDFAQNSTLLIDQNALDQATAIEKVELALWANKHDTKVAITPLAWPDDVAVIAVTQEHSRRWGAKGVDLTPGAGWGSSQAPATYCETTKWKTLIAPVDTKAWLSTSGTNSIAVINNELDGNVGEFGSKFRELVAKLSPPLAGSSSPEVSKLTISDRYIFNPVAVRLYTEICLAFGEQIPEIEVITRTNKQHDDRRSPFKLTHDWDLINDRDDVLEACLRNAAHRVELTLTRDVTHKRSITIDLADRGRVEVVLDQGVGSWIPVIAPSFNFTQSPSRQAEDLMSGNFMIKCVKGGTFVGVL